ncbi:MAG: FUN14 domain-containing protein, partial [Methylophilaceae bacterium]
AVGYFAKKALKMALFIGGAAIVAMFVFEYYGITDISDESLKNAADVAGGAVKSTGGFLMDRLSRITSRGVSATVGFAAGLKLG